MSIKADNTLIAAINSALSNAHHSMSFMTRFEFANIEGGVMALATAQHGEKVAVIVKGTGATMDEALIALARAVVEHTESQANSRNALMALLHEPVEPA